jgi:hypothetical protein
VLYQLSYTHHAAAAGGGSRPIRVRG